MLGQNTILTTQETQGIPEDLGQLPTSHLHFVTFSMPEKESANCRAGGLIVSVAAEFWERVTEHAWTAHARGRAATLTMKTGSGLNVTAAHLNPAWSLAVKRSFLRHLSVKVHRHRGVCFLLGEWNFVAVGEGRERLTGPAGTEDESFNLIFDELFDACAELHQHAQTWRRLPREVGGAAVFSHTDRIYCNIRPVASGMWRHWWGSPGPSRIGTAPATTGLSGLSSGSAAPSPGPVYLLVVVFRTDTPNDALPSCRRIRTRGISKCA